MGESGGVAALRGMPVSEMVDTASALTLGAGSGALLDAPSASGAFVTEWTEERATGAGASAVVPGSGARAAANAVAAPASARTTPMTVRLAGWPVCPISWHHLGTAVNCNNGPLPWNCEPTPPVTARHPVLCSTELGRSRCPAREGFPCVPPWLARRPPFFTGEWDPITRIEARGCFRLRPALVSGPGCPRLPAGLGQARWCRLDRPARRSFRNRSSAIETGGTFPSCTVPWAPLQSAEEVEVYEPDYLGLADGLFSLTK